jgi:hypothetical protein
MLTMSLLKRFYALALVLALVTIVVGVASARRLAKDDTTTVLAIEISMKNGPFTVPAAQPGVETSAHIRVPSVNGAQAASEQVTAVRLMPSVVNDKVQVKVYALYGDVSKVSACKDWEQLKAHFVGEFTAANGEAFQVKELNSLGASFGERPLTVNVVNFKMKPRAQVILDPVIVTACACGGCGDLSCCPNEGYCLECGPCGNVCCKKKSEE